MNDLKNLKKLVNIQKLSVTDCEKLTTLEGIENLKSLDKFFIGKCMIENLNHLASLENLKSLTIDQCFNLTDLTEIKNFQNLNFLFINKSPNITGLNSIRSLKSLKSMEESITLLTTPPPLLASGFFWV